MGGAEELGTPKVLFCSSNPDPLVYGSVNLLILFDQKIDRNNSNMKRFHTRTHTVNHLHTHTPCTHSQPPAHTHSLPARSFVIPGVHRGHSTMDLAERPHSLAQLCHS